MEGKYLRYPPPLPYKTLLHLPRIEKVCYMYFESQLASAFFPRDYIQYLYFELRSVLKLHVHVYVHVHTTFVYLSYVIQTNESIKLERAKLFRNLNV